jgi:sugar/nucleoside kinase (ribokinase family)
MFGHTRKPVVCFSYLAATELWKVPRFPLANYGTEVLSIEYSIAADGPMAAAVLSALDVPTLLLTNDLGDDASGAKVGNWLQCYGVAASAKVKVDARTPQIVVVADDQGTRTWFPHLPGVAEALASLDSSPLERASFAYIDCYQLIEAAAVRAIQTTRAVGVPLLLNLGGSPISHQVITATRGYAALTLQTNVDDERFSEAHRLAALLHNDTQAEWVVITGGASGALALSASECIAVPAFRAEIRHTHCAGAAFSGGLLYGLLAGWPMADSLTLASASGALRCERSHQEPMPTLTELRAFIASRERLSTAAALKCWPCRTRDQASIAPTAV